MELSADVEVQLTSKDGFQPIVYLLNEARQKAASAMVGLVDIDPSNADAIRILQNEVKIYEDMVNACRKMVDDGKVAEMQISQEAREELYNVVMDPDTRRMVGADIEGMD